MDNQGVIFRDGERKRVGLERGEGGEKQKRKPEGERRAGDPSVPGLPSAGARGRGAAQQKSVFRRPGGWRSRPRRQQDRFLRRPPRGVPIAVFNPRLHRAFPQYVSVCPNLLL